MNEFIPPYPHRFSKPLPLWRRLMIARRNFLAMWEDEAFELEFFSSRVFAIRSFLCNSPDAVQFAFGLKSTSFERKAPQMRHALAPLIGEGLFISDGETWRHRRKIIAPIIHTSRLPQYAPVMVEAALEMRARWAALPSPQIDAATEMGLLAAEVISRTLFGSNLGSAQAREIVEGFGGYQRSVGQLDLMSCFGLPDWLPRFHGPAVRRSRRRVHAVLDKIIANYRARDDEPAMIGELLRALETESGDALDAQAVRNEIAVLFLAGHETTANSLAWTWYLLSQAPDVEARMHAEIDAVLCGRPPALADVPRLVFTRAVFEESLRLYPPIPILPREALQDECYQGQVIPKGSLLIVVPWLLHRHRKLWDKPDHFIPDRFLPENAKTISKYAYIPFGIGPRICAGMTFGLSEGILCLATLAQRFSMLLKPGHEVKPVCRLTLRPEGGLPMTLHRRETQGHRTHTAASGTALNV
jgi:cytochrome P450